ncbi:MAG: HD domain-containing protein [Thermoguttaceae bacterium]|nr:HD domain-containing protein [Thermoguttaceae bacterium]MDW8077930.1 HD domain-containing protein [Thermoguttaceae bacterium]
MPSKPRITALADLAPGQEGEFFAILAAKEELKTRDGKPYFRVTFRDARRQVSFPIWIDSRWGPECRSHWQAGRCYRLRALYRESNFGPELDIRQIREFSAEQDKDFVPEWVYGGSTRPADELFAELLALVNAEISDSGLQRLVLALLEGHRDKWLWTPASSKHHFPRPGGLLEHTLRVAQNAAAFARLYAQRYPPAEVPWYPDLVVAGAILHDIGKLLEYENACQAIETPAGGLLGHLVLGRDLLREEVARHPIEPEKLLRLEHILVSHHGQAEFGAVRPPMTLEAILVQFANEVDVRMELAWQILAEKSPGTPWTSDRNVLKQRFYRGIPPAEETGSQ